jgi:hypothetical protein
MSVPSSFSRTNTLLPVLPYTTIDFTCFETLSPLLNFSATIIDSSSNQVSSPLDAFDDLLCALDPYTDELLLPSEFHRFLDLPLELRYNVYEEYYLDEHIALACQPWNGPSSTLLSKLKYCAQKLPFLPPLCLTSHALLSEVVPFIMKTATFSLTGSYLENAYINKRLSSISSATDLRAIRKLRFTAVNNSASLFAYGEVKLPGSVVSSTQLFNSIVSKLDGLREATFCFHAPIRLNRLYDGSWALYAESISTGLHGFDTSCVMQLKSLRNVGLEAKSNYEHQGTYLCRRFGASATLQGDDTEKLLPVMELEKLIKDGFMVHGQDVEVQVQLFYAGQCDVTKL